MLRAGLLRQALMTGHGIEGVEREPGRRATLRPASGADRPAVERLLVAEGLPGDGVAEWVDRFWLAEQGRELVGVAGLELHADVALLRSVAVDPAWRGCGLGRALTERVLDAARAAGASEIYLLTVTAEKYFSRLGFVAVDRAAAPRALSASAEFSGACPASATLMRRGVVSRAL